MVEDDFYCISLDEECAICQQATKEALSSCDLCLHPTWRPMTYTFTPIDDGPVHLNVKGHPSCFARAHENNSPQLPHSLPPMPDRTCVPTSKSSPPSPCHDSSKSQPPSFICDSASKSLPNTPNRSDLNTKPVSPCSVDEYVPIGDEEDEILIYFNPIQIRDEFSECVHFNNPFNTSQFSDDGDWLRFIGASMGGEGDGEKGGGDQHSIIMTPFSPPADGPTPSQQSAGFGTSIMSPFRPSMEPSSCQSPAMEATLDKTTPPTTLHQSPPDVTVHTNEVVSHDGQTSSSPVHDTTGSILTAMNIQTTRTNLNPDTHKPDLIACMDNLNELCAKLELASQQEHFSKKEISQISEDKTNASTSSDNNTETTFTCSHNGNSRHQGQPYERRPSLFWRLERSVAEICSVAFKNISFNARCIPSVFPASRNMQCPLHEALENHADAENNKRISVQDLDDFVEVKLTEDSRSEGRLEEGTNVEQERTNSPACDSVSGSSQSETTDSDSQETKSNSNPYMDKVCALEANLMNLQRTDLEYIWRHSKFLDPNGSGAEKSTGKKPKKPRSKGSGSGKGKSTRHKSLGQSREESAQAAKCRSCTLCNKRSDQGSEVNGAQSANDSTEQSAGTGAAAQLSAATQTSKRPLSGDSLKYVSSQHMSSNNKHVCRAENDTTEQVLEGRYLKRWSRFGRTNSCVLDSSSSALWSLTSMEELEKPEAPETELETSSENGSQQDNQVAMATSTVGDIGSVRWEPTPVAARVRPVSLYARRPLLPDWDNLTADQYVRSKVVLVSNTPSNCSQDFLQRKDSPKMPASVSSHLNKSLPNLPPLFKSSYTSAHLSTSASSHFIHPVSMCNLSVWPHKLTLHDTLSSEIGSSKSPGCSQQECGKLNIEANEQVGHCERRQGAGSHLDDTNNLVLNAVVDVDNIDTVQPQRTDVDHVTRRMSSLPQTRNNITGAQSDVSPVAMATTPTAAHVTGESRRHSRTSTCLSGSAKHTLTDAAEAAQTHRLSGGDTISLSSSSPLPSEDDRLMMEARQYTSDKLNHRCCDDLLILMEQFYKQIQRVSEELVELLQERHELQEQVEMRQIAIEQLVRLHGDPPLGLEPPSCSRVKTPSSRNVSSTNKRHSRRMKSPQEKPPSRPPSVLVSGLAQNQTSSDQLCKKHVATDTKSRRSIISSESSDTLSSLDVTYESSKLLNNPTHHCSDGRNVLSSPTSEITPNSGSQSAGPGDVSVKSDVSVNSDIPRGSTVTARSHVVMHRSRAADINR